MNTITRATEYLAKVYHPRQVHSKDRSFFVGDMRVAYLSDPKFTQGRNAIVDCSGDDDSIMGYLD